MLRRKMLRDIWHNKIQFLSIFLMVFLGSFIYAGIGGEYTGMEQIATTYYQEQKAADIWLYGNDFDAKTLADIQAIKTVKALEKRLVVETDVVLDHTPTLTMNYVGEHDISQMKVIEGRLFDKAETGIYVDIQFANANHLTVNDQITCKINGVEATYSIAGLIMNPDYVYFTKDGDIVPNHKNYGFAYASKAVLPSSIQDTYSQILITTSTKNYGSTVKQIETLIAGKAGILLTQEDQVAYASLQDEITQHRAMGSVFPIAFLVIAVLSVLTTMLRLLSNQRLIISTLKALGFQKRKILFHYLSYGFVISFVGAILGAVLGPLTLPYLFYPAMSFDYSLPTWSPHFAISFLGLPMVLVGCCTLVTYLVCRAYLKESPAQGMRLQVRKTMKKSLLEKFGCWKYLGFSNQWNLRDMLRNKARSLMVIVGIAGCLGLLLCAFGLKDSLDDFVVWQFRDLNHYKTQWKLEDTISSDQLQDLLARVDGEQMMEVAIEIQANDIRRSGVLSVVEDDAKLTSLCAADRSEIVLHQGEIAMSKRIMEVLGLQVGDQIRWHRYGNDDWFTSTIAAVYYSPTAQGITMNRSTLENLGETFVPTQVVSKDSLDQTMAGVRSVWQQSELEKELKERMSMMNLLVYILVIAAVLMALIVLYCLGIISFMEKYRDFATLKVLGFTTRKIRWLLIQQNIYLTMLGIPLGFLFGRVLLSSIMDNMGDSFEILLHLSWLTYVVCAGMTLLISALISILFSKRAKRIDMVEALKGNE